MKPTAVSADALFEDHRGKLKWQWIAGLGASERRFDEVAVRAARSGADLVGYLNYIHPYRVQILGEREVAYLNRGSEEDCARRISRIVTLEPPVWYWPTAKPRLKPCCGFASARNFPCLPRPSRRPS